MYYVWPLEQNDGLSPLGYINAARRYLSVLRVVDDNVVLAKGYPDELKKDKVKKRGCSLAMSPNKLNQVEALQPLPV